MQRIDLGEVDYQDAMTMMAGWVDERRAGLAPDRLFLLTHPPIITFGRHTPPEDLPADPAHIPVVPADRGGHATYHGPGQLVGYLIMNLREHRGPADMIRWLETALIDGLADLGVKAVRRDTPKGADSLVGVWTPEHEKLVSIGMRIRGGVSSHGFALNIDPDLGVFDEFTACRMDDVTMTSLRRIAGAEGRPTPSEAQVRDALARHLCRPR